jgi:hypothetical protein
MAVPDRNTARSFAAYALGSLNASDRRVRLRLCEIVEHCAKACADGEDPAVLTAAAYLQEVGVIFSSSEKPLYSMEIVAHAFGESYADLDDALIDCIANHTRPHPANSPEGRLMQICYKYAVTHYLDYLLLKSRVSEEGFERLQLERIEDYSRLLRLHPRGAAIEETLQEVFLLREKLSPAEKSSRWHRELEALARAYPLAAASLHYRARSRR